MDEAYVVLVCDAGSGICQAFPFATKHGAEVARDWFRNNSPARTFVINDHEPELEPELE